MGVILLERLFKADMFLYERRKQFCLRNGTGRNELLFSLTARAIQKQLALVQRAITAKQRGSYTEVYWD